MHSRKKTPKDEAKEKEKELKAKKFHAAMTKFLNLKKSGCKDVKLLKDISNLLRISPEFSTLWNYRKEILIAFKESIYGSNDSLQEEGDILKTDQQKESLVKEFDQMCLNELSFIENSLNSNPKSYATWHHRVWLIQFMNNPDVNKEIQLCNQCLSLDERNFHCWNYRRFIVKFGNIPLLDEFKFTTRKIIDNFSNFSSWHYRSCLYRQLLADNQNLTELKLMINKDFETVTNAIFTDPNDQSPWLYIRWLIEFENSLHVTPNSRIKIQRFLYTKKFFSNDDHSLFAIELNDSCTTLPNVILKIDEQNVHLKNWKQICKGIPIWIATSDFWSDLGKNPTKFSLMFENEIFEANFCPTKDKSLSATCFVYESDSLKGESQKNGFKRIDALKQLLNIEDDFKWPNYMLTIMDSYDMKNVDAKIDNLINLDPIRKNYYNDLRGKLFLKHELSSRIISLNYDLSNRKLHSLNYMNRLMHIQHLNLSNNHLVKLGHSFWPLINLRCLVLDSNQIKYCDENLCWENLIILSLKNNLIDNYDLVVNRLCKLSSNLKHLNLIGNRLKQPTEFWVTNSNPSIKIYWDSKDELQFKSVLDNELALIQQNQLVWSEE